MKILSHIFNKNTAKIAFALFAVASIAAPQLSFATGQAAFSSNGMFLVGDHKDAGSQNWQTQLTNMVPGDQVAFKFTFLNISSVTAIDAKSSFSATSNGNSIHVVGTIWAQNAPQVSQSVDIYAAPGYTISLSQLNANFGGVGDVLPGSSNIEYYATGLYTITGQAQQQQPTVSLQTNKTQVNAGESVTLSWTSTNATTCSATAGAGFSTGGATSGSDVSGPLYNTTTFAISCTGPGGSTQDQKTVTVNASQQPTATLTANASQVYSGGAVVLTWSSTNATTCQATNGSGFYTGGATSGSDASDRLYTTQTFTVVCTGPGGSAQASKTVMVVQQQQQPTASLQANKTQVTQGENVMLSWTSTNTTSCYATNGAGFSTNNATSGSDYSSALYTTTTFSIRCDGAGGTATDSVTVYVNATPAQQPTASLQASKTQVNQGESVTLSWSSTNATSCQATSGPGFSTNSATSGSDQSDSLSSSTTFSIRCDGAGGSANATVSVYVGTPQGNAPAVQTSPATNIGQTDATFNGQVNPNGLSTSYWFEYGTSQTLGYTTALQSVGSGTSFITVAKSIASLSTNTTYYFRVVAQNSQGTTQGSILSFTTSAGGGGSGSAPTALTNPATNISQTSATFNGQINPNNAQASYWFEYGTSQSLGYTTAAQSAGAGSSQINVQAGVSSLSANTTYYFRSVAQNAYGIARGTILSFTTDNSGGGGGESAPTALTNPASNISQNSATLNGQVNPNGLATSYWFEYGTSQSLGNTSSMQSVGSGTSFVNVAASASSLSSNKTYYFRVVAQNSQGTTQGSTLSFTTNDSGGGGSGSAPYANTNAATNISQNSATLNGQVNPNGSQTSYWFEYGTSQSLGNSTAFQSVGSGSGSVNVSASTYNISQNQTYYFRVVAQNQYGISYGSTLSFYSGSGGGGGDAPFVQTNPATNITASAATLNGYVTPNYNGSTYGWFEYGTNQNYLSYTTNSRYVGSGSYSQNISEQIYSLNSGVTYYFRAVARNDSGTNYGQTLSFYSGGSSGSGQQPLVTTQAASAIGQNSALLNGTINPNNSLATAWFEYGPTASLGSRTIAQPMGSGNYTQNFASAISGLLSNTTYYFRAAAQNSYGTAYGSTLSFTTSGQIYIPPTIVNPPVIIETGGDGLSCVVLVPALNVSALVEGQEFVFTITYRNGCSYNLNNAFLKVILPTEVEYLSTNYPFFNRDANGISYNLGALAPGYQSAISIQGRVSGTVQVGDTLIFSAVLNYTDNNEKFQSLSAYLTAVVANTRTLSASIFDAVRNLIGNWLFDLLLLIAIIFLIWWIFFKRDPEVERVDVLKE